MGATPSAKVMEKPSLLLDRRDTYLRIQSVTIFVRDLDRSLKFYVDQLGFTMAFDGRVQARRPWAAVSPPDGLATLVLAAPERDSEEHKLIGKARHVALVTEDVMAKFREWRKRGVLFNFTPRLKRLKYPVQVKTSRLKDPAAVDAGSSPIWGGVFTRFQDPDGNSFALVSFDELSRELELQRRAVAAKLEAERRVAQELEIAKQVQARLFPQKLPALRTLDYAGVCLQARQVGGDYYDFIDLGPHSLGIAIGDISGKGIAASLLMASLHASVRTQRNITMGHPERRLRSVNRFFYENTSDTSYATLFFAEYIDKLGRLRYASCGHLPGLLLRSNGNLERLESTCTVLGLFDDWDCAVEERRLFPGDLLALYTDGVTEAFNEAEEEFGESRLIEALERHHNLPSQELLASLIDEVKRFSPQEQHDDITMIIAKCRKS